MTLTIAYSNHSNHLNPSIGRFASGQVQAKKRLLKKTARMFKVGSKVLIDGMPATVVGYNIAEFGRWLSISHPIMVKYENGKVVYCKLSDLALPF